MKNVLKLSLLSVGFVFVSSIATAQEAPKADKQDPVKTAPASKSTGAESKTDKADTAKSGATRMAITEQGMPKKKSRKKAAPATSTEPKK